MRCGCLLVLWPFALCSWSAVEFLILHTFLWCFGVVVVVAVGRVGVFSGIFSCGEVLVASAMFVAKRASLVEGFRPGFCIGVEFWGLPCANSACLLHCSGNCCL